MSIGFIHFLTIVFFFFLMAQCVVKNIIIPICMNLLDVNPRPRSESVLLSRWLILSLPSQHSLNISLIQEYTANLSCCVHNHIQNYFVLKENFLGSLCKRNWENWLAIGALVYICNTNATLDICFKIIVYLLISYLIQYTGALRDGGMLWWIKKKKRKSIYSILILAILLYKVTFCLPLIISLILLRIVLLSQTFL